MTRLAKPARRTYSGDLPVEAYVIKSDSTRPDTSLNNLVESTSPQAPPAGRGVPFVDLKRELDQAVKYAAAALDSIGDAVSGLFQSSGPAPRGQTGQYPNVYNNH